MNLQQPHNLTNYSSLPEWYIRRQIDFVSFANEVVGNLTGMSEKLTLPDKIDFYCYNGEWKGNATRQTKTINLWFDLSSDYRHSKDPRYKIQRVDINVKTRTESFLFLLAHEMRHLTEANADGIYANQEHHKRKFRRVWLGEADANGFAQATVELYRKLDPRNHFREFRAFSRIWQAEQLIRRQREKIQREEWERQYKERQAAIVAEQKKLEEQRYADYVRTLPPHKVETETIDLSSLTMEQLLALED